MIHFSLFFFVTIVSSSYLLNNIKLKIFFVIDDKEEKKMNQIQEMINNRQDLFSTFTLFPINIL